MAGVIYSVGHSTLAAEELFALLATHGVGTLADVRAYPASRRHPHFARAALEVSCPAHGVAYHWMPSLGGRRAAVASPSRHPAWRIAAFRHYADWADGAEFRDALAELERLAALAPTAFMCAESCWWQCHRRLIADHLVARGWEVRHIARGAVVGLHALPEFARLEDGRPVYDVGVTPPLVAEPRR